MTLLSAFCRPCNLVAVSLISLAVPYLSGQQPEAVPPSYVLTLGTTRALAVPNFGFAGSPQCDTRGNAYFGIASASYVTHSVLRVPSDGQSETRFPPPKEFETDNLHFSVSPDGDVYELASSTLVGFSNSGDELNRTVLQLPDGFLVASFAVQSNGRIAVQGIIPIPLPKPYKPGDIPEATPVTLFLDRLGKPILRNDGSQVSLSDGLQGKIASGKTGTFLQLHDTTLSVLDLDGHLENSYNLPRPRKDSKPMSLQYIDGQIAVEFAYIDPTRGFSPDSKHPEIKVGPLIEEWAIMNAEDGTIKGFYSLPDGFVGSSLCYLGNHEFLNLSVKNKQTVFLNATMP